MNSFPLLCFVYIVCCLNLSTESKRLHKRQTLVENKRKIGASGENWALVGNIPTPTNGRLRLSDEADEYREQLDRLTNNRPERNGRLTKRWIRDGDIDRERHHNSRDDRRDYRDDRRDSRDERRDYRDDRRDSRDERRDYRDRDSSRERHRTRDGERRHY
ncbi:hypothetical protein O3M35_002664 [Rhynocoris fuscipes]|uniref:Uncharacterized protein n=1 Tax=Rhynocoris fuscipes TaxID=488301 RepID=A0AAW1CMU1_9HEMI